MTNDAALIEAMARALAKKRYGHVGGDSGTSIVHTMQNWRFCKPDAETALNAYRHHKADDGK